MNGCVSNRVLIRGARRRHARHIAEADGGAVLRAHDNTH